MRKNAYTLVEMLVVAAVIAILAGILFGASNAIRARNSEIKTRAILKEIQIALDECKRKFGYYPVLTTLGDFEAELVIEANDDSTPDSVAKKYSREFKKACNFTSFEIVNGIIVDGWGEPLRYRSDGKTYILYSKGNDYKDNATESHADNEDNIYAD